VFNYSVYQQHPQSSLKGFGSSTPLACKMFNRDGDSMLREPVLSAALESWNAA
jgi:hypothetical protein